MHCLKDGIATMGRQAKVVGRWSDTEKAHSINWLELKATFFALKVYAYRNKNCSIVLNLDNNFAISHIKNQGGVVSSLNILAYEIWCWCKTRNIWINARHIPGTKKRNC